MVYIPANPPSPVPEEPEEESPPSFSLPDSGKQDSSMLDSVRILSTTFFFLESMSFNVFLPCVYVLSLCRFLTLKSFYWVFCTLQVSSELEVPKQKSSEVKVESVYMSSIHYDKFLSFVLFLNFDSLFTFSFFLKIIDRRNFMDV